MDDVEATRKIWLVTLVLAAFIGYMLCKISTTEDASALVRQETAAVEEVCYDDK